VPPSQHLDEEAIAARQVALTAGGAHAQDGSIWNVNAMLSPLMTFSHVEHRPYEHDPGPRRR